MCEILFRGKRKDNGEWVYGYYCKYGFTGQQKHYIIPDCASALYSYEVIPETVGQYTGLTDKNGKKIFEGDVVKTQQFFDKPYSKTRKSKQFNGVVEYCIHIFNGNGRYSKQVYQAEWRLKFIEDFGKYSHYSWSEFWDGEVIGNIHDNPELLKEGVDNG